MNLIILSSIPGYVLAMIIIEAIIMMSLGGFLIYDIIRSKIKAIKKEKQEEEARKLEAREKSISLDTKEEDLYSSSGVSELEHLRRMNQEQKEYIALLEKRISLSKQLHEVDDSNGEYVEEVIQEETDEIDEAVEEFLNSIPHKEECQPQEEDLNSEPTGEDTVLFDDEAMDIEPEEIKIQKPSSGVVITASSFKSEPVDLEEKRRQQEKIMAFLKEQEEQEKKEEVIEDAIDNPIEENYDIVEPWYCLAKPFVKKKKKYNNF